MDIGRADTSLIAPGAIWKYLDNGSNQGTAWRATGFNDTAWLSGPAELGYGDGDERTVVKFGPNANARYITTYFRRTINVTNPAAFSALRLRVLRDDGAVIYFNGTEVRRDNMPTGAISSGTVASTALGAPAEATFYETTIAASRLVAGNNVVAVEIHQANGTSTDVSFDLELIGVTPGSTSVTRGPYLQKGTPTSVVVRWRTSSAVNSTVRYGTAPGALTSTASNAASVTDHEVALTGLSPDTAYYYSVGTSAGAITSGSEYTFFTSPPTGSPLPVRVWALGDSGTGDANAAAVRNAYTTFSASRYTDVWLMLGDNAYQNGTDAEFQTAVFNMYPSYLRQSVLWPTIGNHDTAGSATPPATLPYFQMFTLPTAGEAGGAASGTEKYYSFDYGNIHFINLDSMTSDRSVGGAMATWLRADLESTNQTWIIAYWHHPPYTKGSHDSDPEIELKQMRENIVPIMEAGGADLVLTGHSHSYERSYLINGHHGTSGTFQPSMKIDGGDGRESGTGAYRKPGGLAAYQGAVYAVAGASGKISNWTGGSTADTNPNPHPVMLVSLRRLGSMVIDVAGDRLDAKYLRETGVVDDSFTILKNVANTGPTVSVTSPAQGSTFTAPATIDIAATAADSDGTIKQVDFYAGSTLLGTDTTAPYGTTWSNVAAGTYSLTAVATDNLGATTVSAPVTITTSAPSSELPAPTGLAAAAGDAQVSLTWQASAGAASYNVRRATTSGGPYTTVVSGVSTTGYTNPGLTNGTTYYYVVTATGSNGVQSGPSNQASATPQGSPAAPPPPGNLLATGGNGQVALSWSASSGAASYDVKRATVSGGPYALVANGVTTTSFTNAGLTNGTTYYFVVSARNSSGESANSSQVSATPRAAVLPVTLLANGAFDNKNAKDYFSGSPNGADPVNDLNTTAEEKKVELESGASTWWEARFQDPAAGSAPPQSVNVTLQYRPEGQWTGTFTAEYWSGSTRLATVNLPASGAGSGVLTTYQWNLSSVVTTSATLSAGRVRLINNSSSGKKVTASFARIQAQL